MRNTIPEPTNQTKVSLAVAWQMDLKICVDNIAFVIKTNWNIFLLMQAKS